ncbi:unnamed protein product [Amoebophrya sp. A25]|nr:unnamed protein product [Amoebophrya sp. A25]|eukprot:GSA25T00010170001.1
MMRTSDRNRAPSAPVLSGSSPSASSSSRPFVLVVGRPNRSKRTFLNWCAKDENFLQPASGTTSKTTTASKKNKNALRPVIISDDPVSFVREDLDDLVIEVENNDPRGVVDQGASGSRAVAGLGGQDNGEEGDRDTSSAAGPSTSVSDDLPPLETARALSVADCVEAIRIPKNKFEDSNISSSSSSSTPTFVLLPLLSTEEQHCPALWCDPKKVKTLGAGSIEDEGNNQRRSTRFLGLLERASGVVLGSGGGTDGGERDDVALDDKDKTSTRKPSGSGIENLLSFAGGGGTASKLAMLGKISGVTNVIEKSNEMVKSAVSDVAGFVSHQGASLLDQGAHLLDNAQLLSSELEDLLGEFESPEEARAMWRTLVQSLAAQASAVLLFVAEQDAETLRTTDLLELLGTSEKKLHIFIPKWDLKSSSVREQERSALRSAVFQHDLGGNLTLKPVGYEASRETFMFDDLLTCGETGGTSTTPSPESANTDKQDNFLVWNGRRIKVPPSSQSGAGGGTGGSVMSSSSSIAASKRYSYSHCRDVVKEALSPESLSSKRQLAQVKQNKARIQDLEHRTEARRQILAKRRAAEAEKRRKNALEAKRASSNGGKEADEDKNNASGGAKAGQNNAGGRRKCCSCTACCLFCWRNAKSCAIAFLVLLIALVIRRNFGWLLR